MRSEESQPLDQIVEQQVRELTQKRKRRSRRKIACVLRTVGWVTLSAMTLMLLIPPVG